MLWLQFLIKWIIKKNFLGNKKRLPNNSFKFIYRVIKRGIKHVTLIPFYVENTNIIKCSLNYNYLSSYSPWLLKIMKYEI